MKPLSKRKEMNKNKSKNAAQRSKLIRVKYWGDGGNNIPPEPLLVDCNLLTQG